INYQEFLNTKIVNPIISGFDVDEQSLNTNLFDFQRAIVKWALKHGRAAIFADTGVGKQQPLSEPVLTPSGWSTMGELKIGDYVTGKNGLPTKVLVVFPQGVRRVFSLELSDGTFVRAGEDHLWSVQT